MADCAVCECPTGDGGRLCRIHTDILVTNLGSVPDLLTELDITRTRQDRMVSERAGSRSATRPLPWNEHASTVAWELNYTMNVWALEVSTLREDERDPLKPVPARDTAEVARWLTRNINTLRHHVGAGTADEELNDAIVRVRRAVDRAPDKVFAGPCATPQDDGTHCAEDLYGHPGKRTTRCIACGAEHDMDQRRQWMLGLIEDQVAHSGLLAGLVTSLGVPIASSTIRKYAGKGRIKVISVDAKRRPLYRIGDVLDVFLRRAS